MRVRGRLLLDDRVVPGRVHVADGLIEAVELDDAETAGPCVAPGFVDIHVHGWGGHDAIRSARDLDGMSRASCAEA